MNALASPGSPPNLAQLQTTIAGHLGQNTTGAKVESTVNGTVSPITLTSPVTSDTIASAVIKALEANPNASVSVTIGENTVVFERDGNEGTLKTENSATKTTTFDYDNMRRDLLNITEPSAPGTSEAPTPEAPAEPAPAEAAPAEAVEGVRGRQDLILFPLSDLPFSINEDIRKDLGFTTDSSAKSKRMEAAMTLVLTTAGVNKIFEGKDTNSPEYQKFLKAFEELESALGSFWNSEEKIEDAWKKFVGTMYRMAESAKIDLPVKEKEVQGASYQAIKAILDRAESKEVPSAWAIKMLYDNGEAYAPGLTKGGIENNMYKTAKFPFGAAWQFFSQDKDYEFKTIEEMMSGQNIIGKPEATEFWKRHTALRDGFNTRFPGLNDLDLFNKFAEYLIKAGVIIPDDLHDSFWRMLADEDEKLEAIIERSAQLLSNNIDGKKTIEELFDDNTCAELRNNREIVNQGKVVRGNNGKPEQVKLKDTRVKLEDVSNQVDAGAPKDLPTAIATFQRMGGKVKDGSLNGISTALREFYYGAESMPGNDYYVWNRDDDASAVAKRILAGITYLNSEQKAADGKPLAKDDVGLRKAMAEAVETVQPTRQPGAAPAGADPLAGKSQQEIMETLARMGMPPGGSAGLGQPPQ